VHEHCARVDQQLSTLNERARSLLKERAQSADQMRQLVSFSP